MDRLEPVETSHFMPRSLAKLGLISERSGSVERTRQGELTETLSEMKPRSGSGPAVKERLRMRSPHLLRAIPSHALLEAAEADAGGAERLLDIVA